jgi:hypothetical protein
VYTDATHRTTDRSLRWLFDDRDSALSCLHDWRATERFSEPGDAKPREEYRLVRISPKLPASEFKRQRDILLRAIDKIGCHNLTYVGGDEDVRNIARRAIMACGLWGKTLAEAGVDPEHTEEKDDGETEA